MVRFGEERTAAISFGGRFWQHPKCVDTHRCAHSYVDTKHAHRGRYTRRHTHLRPLIPRRHMHMRGPPHTGRHACAHPPAATKWLLNGCLPARSLSSCWPVRSVEISPFHMWI